MLANRRKLLIVAGGIAGGVLLLLLLLPLVFRGPIEQALRDQVEARTGIRVAWSGVGLTFFRDFPHLTLTVRDLTAVGTRRFEADTLASLGSLQVAINATSALSAARSRGPLVVREVRLDRPTLRLRVLEDGAASWDAVTGADQPDSESSSGGSGLSLELRSFELTAGTLELDDARSGLFVSLEGLDHSLSGNFARQSLVARTRGHAERATVRFAGMPYLNGVAVDVDAEVAVDGDEARVRFLDNEIRLNELGLRFSGDVVRSSDGVQLDLAFSAPRTDFADLLSLLPPIYAADFGSLETSGSFAFEGYVRGNYLDASLPSYGLQVTVEQGSFRYPDRPLAVRAIDVDLSIESPGGDADNTVVTLERFAAEIDGQPIEGTLTLRTPISDPEVDLTVSGTLDLADLGNAVKVPALEGIAGTVEADAEVRARRSDLDSARYDAVAARGSVVARQVAISGERVRQPVLVEEASLELSPARAELRTFRARLGSSDVQASAELENLLGYALGEQPLRGSGAFTSNRVVLDEWRSGNELTAIAVPERVDLTLDGSVQSLSFGTLEMANGRGRVHVADQRVTFEGVGVEAVGGRIGLDGWYETLDPAAPTMAFDVVMDSLDLAAASSAIRTVGAFAPVARYARGTFSADLGLAGTLGADLSPVLDRLNGDGSVSTSRVAIEDFPMLRRISDAVSMPTLASPTVEAVRSNIRIEDGRLHVQPFQATVAGLAMTVSGSNGIDQSLDYTLGLRVPRSGLGDAAERAVQGLLTRAGAGGATAIPEMVGLGIGVGGSVTDPTVGVRLDDVAGSAANAVSGAADAAVQQRIDEAQARADAATAEARRRARAQADSLVAEAEVRAEAIRVEAGRLAESVRAEGEQAAQEVLARATNPVTRAAAQPVADRLRREANERAAAIESEADQRAAALVNEARERADAMVAAAGN